MVEWLTLLLLVPAIVVPAVLLLGFAGCFLDSTGTGSPPPREPEVPVSKIIIESAEGQSNSEILLTWIPEDPDAFNNGALDHAEFQRIKLSDDTTDSFDSPSSPHSDTSLERATSYDYQARGVNSLGDVSDWSEKVTGTTLQEPVVILETIQDASFGNVDGKTIKCEIALADLTVPSFTPVWMWITLGQSAAAAENIEFSKVFVGHKAAAGDPWDAVSLTEVLFNGAVSTVVAPGDRIRSDEIAFAWDGTSALIVSMFFSGGPGADQLSARMTAIMPDASNSYFKDGDEAAIADATMFSTPTDGNYLSGVVAIEVSD